MWPILLTSSKLLSRLLKQPLKTQQKSNKSQITHENTIFGISRT